MKITATKRMLALVLTLAMLIPNFAGAILNADASEGYTTATPAVYDLYDLSGATEKTIYGRIQSGTWDQQIGTVSEEHKGNVAFTTKMTVGSSYEHIFIGLAMDGAKASSTSAGYIFEIQAKAGEPDVVVYHKKNASWQASSQNLTFDFNGTYVLEAGIVDLYENGELVGKRAYLKGNGEEICHWDDKNPVAIADLGTVVGIYNEQNDIAVATTYTSSYGEANVYDIYDLTGEISKQVDAWNPTVIGSFAAENKEQAALQVKMNITNERHRYRFAVGNTADGNGWDPKGYGVEIAVDFDGQNHVKLLRNGSQIAKFDDVSGLIGEHVYEFGYNNITFGSNVIGKQIYLKVDGEILYSYEDTNGYLTGDALGNDVTLNHIDSSALTMYSAYENGPSTPAVYDLYDLTGEYTKTIYGRVQTGTWDQQIGNVAESDKGNVAFTTKMTVGSAYEHIFIGLAMDGARASSTSAGYIFEIQAKEGEPDAVVYHKKDASWQASSQGLTFDFNGTYVLEAGIIDLYEGGVVVGKRAYLKGNGEEICHWDDMNPVTNENLGTVVGIYNEQNNITMESTYTKPNFVDSYNLTLGGSTVMNLRLDPAIIGDANATVTVSVAGEEKTYALNELAVDAEGLCVVNAPLAAAQMNDEVIVTVTANGSAMSKSYTIAGYAQVILDGADYTAEQKAVVEAMLNYGAAAQNYFDYNVENLANAGCADNVTNTIGSAYAPALTGKVSGITYYGSSLLMKENISLRHYLKIEGDVSSYTFDFNGEEVTPVATSNVAGANYYVQLDNILPNELDGVYVLTVSAEGNTFSLNYSPMSYIQRMSTNENTKELVQQLYDYHVAAKALAASKVVDEASVQDLYEIGKKL